MGIPGPGPNGDSRSWPNGIPGPGLNGDSRHWPEWGFQPRSGVASPELVEGRAKSKGAGSWRGGFRGLIRFMDYSLGFMDYSRMGIPGPGPNGDSRPWPKWGFQALARGIPTPFVLSVGVLSLSKGERSRRAQVHGGGVAEACVLRLRAAGAALRSGRTVYGL